jgi:hypothetical protein
MAVRMERVDVDSIPGLDGILEDHPQLVIVGVLTKKYTILYVLLFCVLSFFIVGHCVITNLAAFKGRH